MPLSKAPHLQTLVTQDLHVHTSLSSDAEGTILEAARAAAEARLRFLAVTNHLPELPGFQWYRDCEALAAARDECKAAEDETGVCILFGVEVTPLDYQGSSGLGDVLREEFDWIVAGVHYSLSLQRLKENRRPEIDGHTAHFAIPDHFEQTMGLIEKGGIDLLAHPLWGLSFCFQGSTYDERRRKAVEAFPDIYREEIAAACAEKHVALELNEDCRLSDESLLDFALKHDTPLAAATDAHRTAKIGRYQWVTEVVQRKGLGHLLLPDDEISSRSGRT